MCAFLIESCENQYHFIDSSDPVEAIKIRMEERDLKQKDMVGVIGEKGRVQELLNRKKMTIDEVCILAAKLNLQAQILVRDY